MCMFVCLLSGLLNCSCLCMLYSTCLACHIFFAVFCMRVCRSSENSQADFLCVFGLNLLCMLYMHYPSASLHIKDTAIAANVSEFTAVAMCYNLETPMIVPAPFHSLDKASHIVILFYICTGTDVSISEGGQKWFWKCIKVKLLISLQHKVLSILGISTALWCLSDILRQALVSFPLRLSWSGLGSLSTWSLQLLCIIPKH